VSAPEEKPVDGLISLGAAAKAVGINKSTLSRQVKAKQIRSHGGKVRLSEVLEDRASNIDLSQSRRGPKASKPAGRQQGARTSKPSSRGATGATPDATAATHSDDEQLILVDGELLSFADAQRLKENYLGKLRQLEFEKKSGALVDRQVAEKLFFALARENRDAWLGWPARVATLMAAELGIEDRLAADILVKYVRQHLSELGEPAAPELAASNGQPAGVVAQRVDAAAEPNGPGLD
jgi:hypothetical protein